MKTIPLGAAKDQLSALVEETETTHEIVHITKHGKPSVVMMAEAELDTLNATIEWLSKPGIHETVREAEQAIEDGHTGSISDLRAELGLSPAQQS